MTMKKILLVEDELHKRDELSGYLNEYLSPKPNLDVVESVRGAVVAVSDDDYDLIILDMALPTFTTDENNANGGRDQALGGVEILRTLKALGKHATIVIVTQYPDIEIEGKRTKLKVATSSLSKKYGQNIAGALLYKYRSNLNRMKLKDVLGKLW